MLLATATVPGTPRLIMPGVSTKAPPEPMKPLTSPPMKPTMNRKAMDEAERSMNFRVSSAMSIGVSFRLARALGVQGGAHFGALGLGGLRGLCRLLGVDAQRTPQ